MNYTINECGLQPWQKTAWSVIENRQANIILLTGGFGSGKTALNAHIIASLSARRPQKGICVCNTFPTLRDTVGVTLVGEVESCITSKRLSSPLEWNFKASGGETKLYSRTMRYGHEAGQRLKSLNADYLWLVEATELPKEAYTYGISRLRNSGDQAYYPVIIETNPSSKSSWVWKLFIEDSHEIYRNNENTWWVNQKQIEYRTAFDKVGKLNIIVFNMTTYANPFFPEATLAQMKNSYSPSEVQRLIYGEWNASEGRVIENYTLFPHPLNPIEHAKKYDRIILGCDVGQDTPTSVIFIGQAGPNFEVFDEFYAIKKSVRDVLQEVNLRLETWGLAKTQNLFVDPSASGWLAEWMSIPNQSIWGYKAIHRGTDWALNRAIRIGEKLRTRQLIVNDLCRNLINDFENTVYKKGGKDQIDKDLFDPHALDALGYGLTSVI